MDDPHLMEVCHSLTDLAHDVYGIVWFECTAGESRFETLPRERHRIPKRSIQFLPEGKNRYDVRVRVLEKQRVLTKEAASALVVCTKHDLQRDDSWFIRTRLEV